MNTETTKTRSEQRIEQLINIGRPLTEEESDELYRALHADYMRKWRLAKAAAAERAWRQSMTAQQRKEEKRLLERVKQEAAR